VIHPIRTLLRDLFVAPFRSLLDRVSPRYLPDLPVIVVSPSVPAPAEGKTPLRKAA
jgi:hypothetical protein